MFVLFCCSISVNEAVTSIADIKIGSRDCANIDGLALYTFPIQ